LFKAVVAVHHCHKSVADRVIFDSFLDSPPMPAPVPTQTISDKTDEEWLLKMVGQAIRDNEAFKNVTVQTFQNRDEALEELLHTNLDLLITDLRSDNVPGRTEHFGMSGFELLSLLAQRDVEYPILVFSGSLAMEGIERRARQCSGQKLKVSFLQKPATPTQLLAEIHKVLPSVAGSDKPAS
jgi:CheY-like chemotaxis protein